MVISATTFTSQNNNNNLRDASFSSYLNNKKETFVDSSHPFISSNRKETLQLGVRKEEDDEIGVFDAEKYFNGVQVDTPTPRVATIDAYKFKYMKNQQQTCLQNRKLNKVQYGTPSVGSESSLNSQNALLQTSVKKSSRNRKNQVHRKSLLAILGCKCSCYDKNSVDVNDHAGEISFNKGLVHGKSKTTSEKLFKHDQDASKKTETRAAKELVMNKDMYIQKQEKISSYKMQLQQVENPRKTLEVFGSPILSERCKSLSFDMRLKKPSWEIAGSKLEEEIEFSTNSGENENYDDEAGSDASSDLFEIESFTGKTNPSFCRTSSNVASGCPSPTCYAPSEASIEWSVITASAVEYSAHSDHEDQETIRTPTRTSLDSSNGKTRINKEIPRRRPGKFLGCNSQKAVGVAADAFTATCEKQSTNPKIHGKSDMVPQVTKFKVESFGARNEQHGYAKPPLRRSHSPHGAQVLYI
ncbi:unnamed protein product [Lathyrus sativus]|nr:unnamed protein product [Lathyrus sativus]